MFRPRLFIVTVDGCLGYFHRWALVSSAAVSVRVHVYLFICFLLFGVLECSFLHPPTPDWNSYLRGVREGSERK